MRGLRSDNPSGTEAHALCFVTAIQSDATHMFGFWDQVFYLGGESHAVR